MKITYSDEGTYSRIWLTGPFWQLAMKYHNGFENSVPTASGPIWVSMEFNPSHLEAADPVALGSVRAREDQLGDREGNQVLGILVHGDENGHF